MHLHAEQVVQISDVRGHNHLRSECQRDRVFQMPTHRQDFLGGGFAGCKLNRQGSVSPPATENLQTVRSEPGDRIVHRANSRPVVC